MELFLDAVFTLFVFNLFCLVPGWDKQVKGLHGLD